MERTYLVTGAAGHLGGEVVRQLLAAGRKVRALVLPGEKHPPAGAAVYEGDVRRKESLLPCFQGLGEGELAVIHCAGIVSITSAFRQEVYDVNVLGTRNVAELCLAHPGTRLAYISSVHAIPELPAGQVIREVREFTPERVEGHYAKSKAEATAYILAAADQGLDALVLHPSGITGPYDPGRGHLTALVTDYCKGSLTAGIRGGYDFVDVRDVAAGVLAAVERAPSGETYILSNRYYQVPEILELLHRLTGKRAITRILPLWFARFTAPLSELYYRILRKPPLYTPYSIYTLQSNSLFSHEKADRELGYRTRPMEETLKDTIAWLQEQGRIS